MSGPATRALRAAALVLALVAPAAASRAQGARPTGADSVLLARADLARIQGNASAKVWVVIVSDFECPYCEQWHRESYDVLRREYVQTGKVRMAYLNLPLSNHRFAMPAAEVAMCAGAQGKFWEAQDAIFRAQAKWRAAGTEAPKQLEALAVQAGANAAELRSCVASGKMRPLIEADADRANRAGANSTPTFLIGNQRVMGAQPVASFRKAIDSALAAAGGR